MYFFLMRNKQEAFRFRLLRNKNQRKVFQALMKKYFHQEAQHRFELLKKTKQKPTTKQIKPQINPHPEEP